MRVLSVRQPWAELIVSGRKDIENRTWRPPASAIGERIAIHASKRVDLEAYLAVGPVGFAGVPDADLIVTGAIVGTVRVTGACESSASPWFSGPIGWLLSEARHLYTPIPYRGALGLRELPDAVAREIVASSCGACHGCGCTSCAACSHASRRFNNGLGAITCGALGGRIVSYGTQWPAATPDECPLSAESAPA